jgi:hypothetical protein
MSQRLWLIGWFLCYSLALYHLWKSCHVKWNLKTSEIVSWEECGRYCRCSCSSYFMASACNKWGSTERTCQKRWHLLEVLFELYMLFVYALVKTVSLYILGKCISDRLNYGYSWSYKNLGSAGFLLKMVLDCKEWPKVRSEMGGISYTSARNKVYECCSGLCPSEKELPERCSGKFRHKNTPSFR